jgi:replication factor C small subunit
MAETKLDLTETSWRDKYSPSTLSEMALDPQVRGRLEAFIKSGSLPDHVLLFGPPGVGKSTAAKILLDKLEPQVLSLNASKDRGIEAIKGKVATFAKTYPMGASWKVVLMDEADGLTPEAQGAMRGDDGPVQLPDEVPLHCQ